MKMQNVVVTLGSLFVALFASAEARAQLDNPVAGLTPEERAMFDAGKALFQHQFTAAEGLGPLFNAHACSTCHIQGGVGGGEQGTAHNVTHYGIEDNDRFFDGFEFGGPVREQHSLAEEGDPDAGMCTLQPDQVPVGVPELIVAHRHTPPVFGFGLVDAIPDDEIRSYEGAKVWKTRGVLGVANWGTELEGIEPLQAFSLIQPRTQPSGTPRVGRFGWHAPVATLFQFSTEPSNVELGISTPFFPRENHPQGLAPLPPECRLAGTQPNDANSQKSVLLYLFQAFTAPPPRAPATAAVHAGEQTFRQIGCTDCHREKHHTAKDYYALWPDGSAHRVDALSDKDLFPWSDFLTHDMGPLLDDHRYQGRVDGAFWRTTPLWGLRFRTEYLHDGSASTLDDAIAAHGGEGAASRDAYFALSPKKQADVDAFLNSL